VSLNKLIEEWSTAALVEFDTELRFRMLAAKGDTKRALRILDKLDALLPKAADKQPHPRPEVNAS
jgi:hypothetical protein